MKTTDFEPGKKYTFVVPTGSLEQHGPFLPLGTDSFIQDRLIQGVEKNFPDVIFLPTMRITCSQEHEGFAGSVWIRYTTMKLVMKEICESLQPYANQIIFVTAHGGNVDVLNEFVEENQTAFNDTELLYLEMNSKIVDKKTMDAISGPIDDHAGNTEISMMLSIDETITSIPRDDYPKTIINQPFKTNRLKDFSEDGIADNHPSWTVGRELGENISTWIIEDFSERLKTCLI